MNKPNAALLSDILWSLVAVAILVAGFLGFRTLGALKEPIAAAPIERAVPPVEVAELRRHAGPVPVTGEGFVRAERRVELAAERAGRVLELHPAVRARGRVREGETIARLDDRDAQAALTRAESDIASTQARLELNTVQLERTRALRRRGVVSEDALDQALSRQSELEGTLASLASARRSAEVALDATAVRAPFDGRILSKAVELGAVVGAGQGIATLASVDALEVTVALEEGGAALVPGLFDDRAGDGGDDIGDGGADDGADGAPATVSVRFANVDHEYAARVARVAPALDEATRTLDVTVRLLDAAPVATAGAPAPAGPPPALINAYATVTIEGAAPARAAPLYAVPDATLREADTLWLVADGALRIVDARVLRVEGGTAYVHLDDVPAGAALVTSVLPAPVDGMAVAIVDAGEGGDGADASRTASTDAGSDAGATAAAIPR